MGMLHLRIKRLGLSRWRDAYTCSERRGSVGLWEGLQAQAVGLLLL